MSRLTYVVRYHAHECGEDDQIIDRTGCTIPALNLRHARKIKQRMEQSQMGLGEKFSTSCLIFVKLSGHHYGAGSILMPVEGLTEAAKMFSEAAADYEHDRYEPSEDVKTSLVKPRAV